MQFQSDYQLAAKAIITWGLASPDKFSEQIQVRALCKKQEKAKSHQDLKIILTQKQIILELAKWLSTKKFPYCCGHD